jgi:hypothetical protein
VPIENRDLLLAVELRLRIECLSRQIVNYVLVCAVSRESRVEGFNAELILVPKQVSRSTGSSSCGSFTA